MSTPYLKDSLPADKGKDLGGIEWAAEDDEPQLNCWCEVPGTGLYGDETISYMFVNGAFVRDHVFIDYVEGGHYYRYSWIAEDQIWIEDILSIIDQVCTGVHEIHERFRMKYKGWTYLKAHESACRIERKLRDLLLVRNYTIPPTCDIIEIFAMEGRGEDCAEFAEKLFKRNMAKLPNVGGSTA